jgi:hypothetical protein
MYFGEVRQRTEKEYRLFVHIDRLRDHPGVILHREGTEIIK